MTIIVSLLFPFCSNGSIITEMNVKFGTLPSAAEIEKTIMKANATLNITSQTFIISMSFKTIYNLFCVSLYCYLT